MEAFERKQTSQFLSRTYRLNLRRFLSSLFSSELMATHGKQARNTQAKLPRRYKDLLHLIENIMSNFQRK
jgi:hypothetical protein